MEFIIILIVCVIWYLNPNIDKTENDDTIIWYGRKDRKWFKIKDIIGW